MSKKYMVNSVEKTPSPRQVYLEKLSSGVFRDLFRPGLNNLLPREEAKKSPKRSPYNRPKAKVQCGSAFAKRKAPSVAPRKVGAAEGPSKGAQRSRSAGLAAAAARMAVVGSSVQISSHALARPRETFFSARAKGPCTLRAAATGEADSAKKLCILSAVKPTNVESEKVKFFQSAFSYNPQFEYSSPAFAQVLARHSNASDCFLAQVSLGRLAGERQEAVRPPRLEQVMYERLWALQAVRILELVLQRYGSYEAFERLTGGSLLTRSRIWHDVKKYLEKEGCVGEVGGPRPAAVGGSI